MVTFVTLINNVCVVQSCKKFLTQGSLGWSTSQKVWSYHQDEVALRFDRMRHSWWKYWWKHTHFSTSAKWSMSHAAKKRLISPSLMKFLVDIDRLFAIVVNSGQQKNAIVNLARSLRFWLMTFSSARSSHYLSNTSFSSFDTSIELFLPLVHGQENSNIATLKTNRTWSSILNWQISLSCM